MKLSCEKVQFFNMIKIKIPTKSTYFSSDAITHQQMTDKIFEYAMQWGRLIGVNIFDKDFVKANKKMTFLTFIINVYDIYLFRSNLFRCAFCILSLSAEFQGFGMISTFILSYKNILNLRKQSEKFHEHFSSLKTSKIFEENFMVVAHATAVLTFLGIGTFISMSVYPIIYFLIFDERILHFGPELPFIDWKYSWIGYGLNFLHQSSLLFVFVTFSFISLCIIISLMASGICQFDVLEFLLEELNDLIIQNEDGSKNDEIRNKIKFLVKTHQNLIQFLQEMRETFKMYYFVDLSALVLQKTSVLFAVISVSYHK